MGKILNIFGIEWSLLIIAISFIDPSAAMFVTMFVVPFAALFFYIINFIIKKFEQNIILQKIFKVMRVISIFSAIAASIFIIMYGIKHNSPSELFKAVIANPIPESVRNIERNGNISAMGSSSFYMVFDISSTDFETIIKSEKFSEFHQNDTNNITGRRPELYKKTLSDAGKHMDNVAEIYIFEHSNSGYRFDALIVNKEHTRVYYSST